MTRRKALVLLAHGSRDPQWIVSFQKLRQQVLALAPSRSVALAYLEHAEPSFEAAIDALAKAGETDFQVVPLFLGSGAHVRADVPALIAAASARWPALAFSQSAFIGDAPDVLDAIARYALSSLNV